MALITSDIVLTGKHASIARALTSNSIYQSGAELFTEGALLGIYLGKKSEVDISSQDKIEVTISRTYFQKRNQLEEILFVFLQHEKVYQGRSLRVPEVFNFEIGSPETKLLLEEIKAHALYGIEQIGSEYSSLLNKVSNEIIIDKFLDQELVSPNKLAVKVENDKHLYFKQETDPEIEAFLDIWKELSVWVSLNWIGMIYLMMTH